MLGSGGIDFGVSGGDGEVLACRCGGLGAGLLHAVAKGFLHALGDQGLTCQGVDARRRFGSHFADFFAQHAPVARLDGSGQGAKRFAQEPDAFGDGNRAGAQNEDGFFQAAHHDAEGGHAGLRLTDFPSGLEDGVFEPVPARHHAVRLGAAVEIIQLAG